MFHSFECALLCEIFFVRSLISNIFCVYTFSWKIDTCFYDERDLGAHYPSEIVWAEDVPNNPRRSRAACKFFVPFDWIK